MNRPGDVDALLECVRTGRADWLWWMFIIGTAIERYKLTALRRKMQQETGNDGNG